MPEGAVYVGRPTVFGNPYRVGEPIGDPPQIITPASAIEKYRWLARDRIRREGSAFWLEPLRGHDLACWCPETCGADVDLGWGEFGGPYDPCALPRGHAGHHDPSAPTYCHADVLLELVS